MVEASKLLYLKTATDQFHHLNKWPPTGQLKQVAVSSFWSRNVFHSARLWKVFWAIVLPEPSAILSDPSKFPSPSQPSAQPPFSFYLDPQNSVQIQMHKAPFITGSCGLTMKHELGHIWILKTTYMPTYRTGWPTIKLKLGNYSQQWIKSNKESNKPLTIQEVKDTWGVQNFQKIAPTEKERTTYYIDPIRDIRAQEWQIPLLSISDPLEFFWAPMAPPTPLRGRKQREHNIGRVKHTGRERERQRETERGGGISPAVEMVGTVAAVHLRQYLLKSSLFLHVCLQHHRKRQRPQSKWSSYTQPGERERNKERERAREGEREKCTGKENKCSTEKAKAAGE